MIETIKMLCNIDGVSGNEDAVREKIIALIDGHCEYRIDPLGSILCNKKGHSTPRRSVMFSAHMDEVGFIVTDITSDGFLKLMPVGGILDSALQSRLLRAANGTRCVFGGRTWHLLSDTARKEYSKPDGLYGDIGAVSREDAEKHIAVGDTLAFDIETRDFGENRLCGKALDDRVGCAVMIDMIRGELEYDAAFAFTVGEEVGLRGAGPAAFTLRPEVAVVLEGTTAADLYGSQGASCVTVQGKGAALSFADRATLYDRPLLALAETAAEKKGIAHQLKTAVAGGNDAGEIHKAASGAATLAISVPARYIHTSQSTVDKDDIISARALAEAVLSAVQD